MAKGDCRTGQTDIKRRCEKTVKTKHFTMGFFWFVLNAAGKQGYRQARLSACRFFTPDHLRRALAVDPSPIMINLDLEFNGPASCARPVVSFIAV